MRLAFGLLASGLLLLPACAKSEEDSASDVGELNSSACKEAHIASLKIARAVNGEPEEIDACRAGANLEPEVSAAIRSIKEIHEKAAALFKVDAKQLFGTGVRIQITSGDSGFNGEFQTHDEEAEKPLVRVDTVIDPQNLLNRGIYAHELGHWLYWVPKDKMPMALRSLGQSHFWGESLADTFALAIEGTVTSSEPGMPTCLESRNLGSLANRSYNGPNGFFLNRFQRSQSFACCKEIENKPEFSKGTEACLAQEELEQSSPFDPSIPFDETPFPVADAAKRLREYSRYQLGIPVNSFLLEASKEVDPSILRRFLEAAREVKLTEFTCSLGKFTDVGKTRVVTASVREQLALVKKGLPAEKQAAFDAIAKKHGLEALDVLEPAEIELRAVGLATNLLLVEGAPGTGKPLDPKHECTFQLQFSQLSSTIDREPKCAVTCSKVP